MDAAFWGKIQDCIWSCDSCRNTERVAINIRQQTDVPDPNVKLLIVGIAPPYVRNTHEKTIAKSATNDPKDNLRQFIEKTLDCSWNDLRTRGVFFVHGVKCGILPKERHQNPPDNIVDICAPQHLGQELNILKPSRVVALGKAAVRGILKGITVTNVQGFGISKPLKVLVEMSKRGIELQTDGWKFRLHISPFPLVSRKAEKNAENILLEAAQLSEITTS